MHVMESSTPPVLCLPPEAEPFIRLQRTHYPAGQQLADQFSADLWGEYETFRTQLPARAQGILDIGCGVGGIDIMLFAHYGRPRDLQFHMLDKTSLTPKVYYGFEKHGAYYNSLAITRALLERNGIPAASIHLLEAPEDGRLKLDPPMDLIISLLSWGYHYPIDTYLDAACALLAPDGRLIVDVREKTNGEELLKTRFSRVERIWEGNSAWRVVAAL